MEVFSVYIMSLYYFAIDEYMRRIMSREQGIKNEKVFTIHIMSLYLFCIDEYIRRIMSKEQGIKNGGSIRHLHYTIVLIQQ